MPSETWFSLFSPVGTPDDEELDAEGMIDPGMEYLPPPSAALAHTGLLVRKKLHPTAAHIKHEAESEEDEGRDREEDYEEHRGRNEGPALSAGGCAGVAGGERRRVHPEKGEGPCAVTQRSPRYAPLTLYEERMLLRRLDACPLALAVTPQAKRLHRKLLVRQAKRQRGLPLLDIDQAVSATLTLVGGIYGAQEGGSPGGCTVGKYGTSSQDLRILDRFQVLPSYLFKE